MKKPILISIIIGGIIAIAAIVVIIIVNLPKKTDTKITCSGGKFPNTIYQSKACTISGCTFDQGNLYQFSPVSCTPTDDDDTSCDSQCNTSVTILPPPTATDQTPLPGNLRYIKSVGACLTPEGLKKYNVCKKGGFFTNPTSSTSDTPIYNNEIWLGGGKWEGSGTWTMAKL